MDVGVVGILIVIMLLLRIGLPLFTSIRTDRERSKELMAVLSALIAAVIAQMGVYSLTILMMWMGVSYALISSRYPQSLIGMQTKKQRRGSRRRTESKMEESVA